MKKILVFLLAVCLALPLAACGDTTDDGYTVPTGFKLISNDIVDYYMIVPDDWVTDMSTGVVSAKCSSVDPTNISVITQELETAMTLDEYWAQYGVTNATLFGEVTYLTEGASLLLNRKEGEKVSAKRYTYSTTIEETVYVFDQVVCIYKNYVYLITLTATEANYTDAHINEYKDMLDYFQFRI